MSTKRIILSLTLLGLFASNAIQSMENEIANNRYALHHACIDGQLEKAKLLIAAGAKINAKDGDGYTPLHHAAWYDHANVAKVLIEVGADVNAQSKSGYTPLHKAAVFGHAEVAKLLIAAGAVVNAENAVGETPLHQAALNGHAEIARLLIEVGAEVNAKITQDYLQGWTPLHYAALNGHVEIAQLLIEAGADVNAKTTQGYSQGSTPLHHAALNGRVEIAQLLLSRFTLAEPEIPTATFIDKDAKVKIWDLESLSLMNALNTIEDFDVACFEDYPTLLNKCENILPFIDLHQDKIRQLLTSNEYTSKALVDFCEHKHLEWLKKLIAMKDNENKTALDLARYNNKHDFVQLLEAAADVQGIDELPDELKFMIKDNIKAILLS